MAKKLVLLILLVVVPLLAESSISRLGQEAGKLRGLSYRSIPSQVVSQQEASAYVLRLLKKELAGKDVDVREALLKELRLMPQAADSRQIYRKIYSSQVRGLYDPAKKRYIVVRGGKSASPTEALGASLGLNITDLYTVHELGHAIQDQHFNLTKISKKVAGRFDASFAALSLIEGDASVLMMDHALQGLGISPESVGGLSGGQNLGMDPGMLTGSDPALAGAPAFFRESITGPYIYGTSFVQALKKKGGWARVNQAFRRLPTTSEQIFHPEKFVSRTERPRKVTFKELPSTIGGFKMFGEDRAGEFTVRILEQELTGMAGSAASGWGGDRFRVYQKGKQRFVLWRTVWDRPVDAREFAALARKALSRGRQSVGKDRWEEKGKLYLLESKGNKVNLKLGIPKALAAKV